MVSAAKVIVPVLVSRLIPVPPDPVELVAAKLKFALEVLMLRPMPVGFVMVVEPLDILPATLVKLIPVVELFVDDMLPKAAVDETGPLSVPVVRLRARPLLPPMVVSASVRVPKLLPVSAVAPTAVTLSVTPRIVLADPKVMLSTAAVMTGFEPPVEGRRFVPDGVLNPVIVNIDWLAPCPMSFSPLVSVKPPV